MALFFSLCVTLIASASIRPRTLKFGSVATVGAGASSAGAIVGDAAATALAELVESEAKSAGTAGANSVKAELPAGSVGVDRWPRGCGPVGGAVAHPPAATDRTTLHPPRWY